MKLRLRGASKTPRRPIRGSRAASPQRLHHDPGSRILCGRLIGTETEYATRFRSISENDLFEPPTAAASFHAIRSALQAKIPTALATDDSETCFLANGAMLSLETQPSQWDGPGGLVEMATAESRSPSTWLACQRAVDGLMEDAASDARVGPESTDGGVQRSAEIRVLKNSRDAQGHIYGTQENYEVDVAEGFGLLIYRLAVMVLWFIQVLCWLATLPIITLTTVTAFCLAIGIGLLNQPASSTFHRLPGWFTTLVITGLRLTHLPMVWWLRFIASHIAFRRQQRFLSGMLVSRVALCGAGMVDSEGYFHLSAKGNVIDRVADLGGFQGERPIFVFGHWLTLVMGHSYRNLLKTPQLFARRQRLQIGLSDSNLADTAEFVRVGSVSLVLDMIEAGWTKDLPVLRSPLRALSKINRDWNLVKSVSTDHGELTALEIQRRVCNAARRFVDAVRSGDVDNVVEADKHEAELVLQEWSRALEKVTMFRRDARQTEQALGHIDWLAKRWMIDHAQSSHQVAVRQMIDIRYHELHPDGYFRRLDNAVSESTWLDGEMVRRLRRVPPVDSPAWNRGRMIREFSGGDDPITCDWRVAVIGSGRGRRKIRF
ncbi:MAG: proteasome accessory factor PafA2 family protein [Planctomycetota bacterium]